MNGWVLALASFGGLIFAIGFWIAYLEVAQWAQRSGF